MALPSGSRQLQRRFAELEDDAVVFDTSDGEVIGPGLERRAVGHRERQVIERRFPRDRCSHHVDSTMATPLGLWRSAT